MDNATTSTNAPGLHASTLCEAFQRTVERLPDQPALRTPGDEVRLTWRQYARRVRRIAEALASLGVRRGDSVGIMLANRPEFHLIDTATLHLGAIPFSMYVTSAPEQIAYVLDNAACRVLFVESRFLPRVRGAATPWLEHMVVIDGDEGLTLERLEAGHARGFDLAAAARQIRPSDLATVIYTSGTTGPPKGVELTHANMMYAIRGCDSQVRLRVAGSAVSYLPHAHLADRLVAHYVPMATGAETTTVADPAQVMSALPGCRPSMFMAVPRVWEKLRAALLTGFAKEPHERAEAIDRAVRTGLEKVRAEQRGEAVPAEVLREWQRADETIFAGIRERIGLDRADWIISGAAPIPTDVVEFFYAIGVRVCEGWGMTETSALGAINRPDSIRIGTVGPPMPNTELRLDVDGEVLVRGPHVMRGYRHDAERTAEVLSSDGWLRTGDIGRLDDAGHLVIIDRKKDLIINAAGKNMSPANIEAALMNSSPLIGQACCIGDARPFNVALLVPDPDSAATVARSHGLCGTSLADLIGGGFLDEAIAAAVERANATLSRVEQVKRYRVLPVEWLPDGDELTPTSKLKRKSIAAKYADTIEELYADS
ncbi:long-chain fatty acid--CoA ligase [Prauserella sp. PE36]|uniref:Acyl-CoA synthetase n=1 Tax=Prauserella endophytica TaxID=1592324 RepID=A0ABY2S2K7_9PSEU|nr:MULTISPECIES: AMP-dependent synthetase/ligase [Prauserella]RBM10338.1 long-chain fatty acid--CoA ligase [Prauserella sp. PE36]TKG68350.1 long-chain fatty acid--CoA ligase [Prauserella endophytica]